jgi:hypothetical protein
MTMPEPEPNDLETWTDRTAHREWLEIRHGVTQTEFALPENVRHDAVARLHKIIRDGIDGTSTYESDKLAIAAVLALAKLATTTTATVSRRAEMLSKHIAHQGPLSTDPHDVRIRNMIRGMSE